MAKISLVSAKYIVHVSISIDGAVDKPDVIGAIFGQTEGLLGSELELRELQRSGRIGRIEVNLDVKMGKSNGSIIIPSSLDKVETVIIAAALETIQRIGPCNSKVKVESIEDVRISKRDQVISRAQELLRDLTGKVLPDSQELADLVSQSVRVMEITEYGRDRLPSGPGIDEAEEVVLVEGRADVLNLLKHGFKNVIAIGGTNIPESIHNLAKEKTLTLFVDGDRGGDLILKGLLNAGIEIDFVTRAPDGKEVEEITKKEIHKALRSKVAVEQIKFEVNPDAISSSNLKQVQLQQQKDIPREMPPRQIQEQRPYQDRHERQSERPYQNNRNGSYSERQQFRPSRPISTRPILDRKKLKALADDLIGSRAALLLNESLETLGKVPLSELLPTLKSLNNVHAIILDGTIDKSIVINAERTNVKYLIGNDLSVRKQETRIELLTNKEL